MFKERNLNIKTCNSIRQINMKPFKILLLCLFLFSLQSCGGADDGYITNQQSETKKNESSQNNNQNKGEDNEGQEGDEGENDKNNTSEQNIEQNEGESGNNQDKTLNILAIGNSFTEDGTAYLPSLVKNAGIKNVTIAKMVIGGTSLLSHHTHALKNDTVYNFYVSTDGNFKSQGKKCFYDCLLLETWDFVILQQVSQHSGMYRTYQPYLNNLINIIHSYYPQAVIAWQMTWAYSSTSTHTGFKNYENNQTVMYESILDAVNQMKTETGINVIIPTGMVIQELRSTSINNYLELTRDGYHLDYGAGRYAAACTWFETLIRPVFQVGVKGNTLRANTGNVPVTDGVASLCQEIAENVVKKYYGN